MIRKFLCFPSVKQKSDLYHLICKALMITPD